MKLKNIMKTTLENFSEIGIVLKHLFILAQTGDDLSDFDVCIKQQLEGFKPIARNLVALC